MASTFDTISETYTSRVGGNYSITIQDPTITQRLTNKTNISVIGHVSRQPTRYSSVKFLSADYSVSEGWVKINFSLSISSGSGGYQLVQYEDGSDLSMGTSNMSYIVTAYATFSYDEPITSSGSTSSNYSGSVTNVNGDYHNQMGGGLYIMDSEGNAVYVGHPSVDRNRRTLVSDIQNGTITSNQYGDPVFLENYLNVSQDELNAMIAEGNSTYSSLFTNILSPNTYITGGDGSSSNGTKSVLPSGYNYQGSNINNYAANPISTTASVASFDLSSKSYLNAGATFIKYLPFPSTLRAWGNSEVTLNYKYEGSQIKFTDSESCPSPTVDNSTSYTVPFSVSAYMTSTSSTYSLYYNSSDGYIKYTSDGTTSGGSNLVKSYGCFIALQAGGGGGGGGAARNAGGISGAYGAPGGGGGGFALVYVNLRELARRGGNGHIEITVGGGGSYGGGAGNHADIDGQKGGDGGDTVLKVVANSRTSTVVTTSGGKGGRGSYDGSRIVGDGGGVVYASYDENIINLVYSTSGKAGGQGGAQSGYIVGIPFGSQDGYQGESFSSSDTISIPFLNSSGNVYGRNVSGYTSGRGQSAANWGTEGYRSGGGGGGASVMGRSTGTNTGGYGMGGYGGAAESGTVHQAQSGQQGACVILSTTNL